MLSLGHLLRGVALFYFAMQIITSLPRYSDGEINRALIREIQTGFQLERETEKAREAKAQAEAEALRNHRTIKGLGKCVAVIPERDYFRLIKKYSHAEVHSKEFLRYYNKAFPHLSPNRA